MKLYHFEIGFPRNLSFAPLFGFTYSAHAREEAHRDGITALPQNFIPRRDKVVEVETDDSGNLNKIVFRRPTESNYDLVVVLLIQTKAVKTVWKNDRRDRHFTLDRTRYDRP
jgi:hypothetical protein